MGRVRSTSRLGGGFIEGTLRLGIYTPVNFFMKIILSVAAFILQRLFGIMWLWDFFSTITAGYVNIA